MKNVCSTNANGREHHLREHHLCLKLEKCEFHHNTIHFLGYIINECGVQMDQKKVEAILKWLQPSTIKDLHRFLGLANFYRRFISNFSQICAPHTSENDPSLCPGIPQQESLPTALRSLLLSSSHSPSRSRIAIRCGGCRFYNQDWSRLVSAAG